MKKNKIAHKWEIIDLLNDDLNMLEYLNEYIPENVYDLFWQAWKYKLRKKIDILSKILNEKE